MAALLLLKAAGKGCASASASQGKRNRPHVWRQLTTLTPHERQVVDFWAMNKDTAKGDNLREIMSMHHSHDYIAKLIPEVRPHRFTKR